MNKVKLDIDYWNKELKDKSPECIIKWAMELSQRRIVTTSFGKYSAVLLNTFNKIDEKIPVVWCDSGYNITDTYSHAIKLIDKFQLNIYVYAPQQSKAFTDLTLGTPELINKKHKEFTEIVKLEPFRRAMNEHKPEVWFTNIRVRQTAYRDSKDILSFSKKDVLKVSPFYYWTDIDLDNYLDENELPNNFQYFDPIKALKNRECGIHFE